MTQSGRPPEGDIVFGHTPAQHVAQMMTLQKLSVGDLARELDITPLAAEDFLAGHYIVTARLASHLEAAFGIGADDWTRWDRETRAREACLEEVAPTGRLAALFALEQAWWGRQQAWGKLVRLPKGPDQNAAWAAWQAACDETEKAANTLAGDETGEWRTAFYCERPLAP